MEKTTVHPLLSQIMIMMASFRYSGGNRSAFTLIELLVVISIIAVLAALAVPAVNGAMEKSNSAQDMSNLRQIGSGVLMYTSDHGGKMPETSCIAETQEDLELTWIYALRNYLGQNYDKVRVSPSDPNQKIRRQFRGTSYVINDEVDGTKSLSRLQRIESPSRSILLFLASPSKNPRGQEDHIHLTGMRNWSRLLNEITPDAHNHDPSDRTAGSSPYLFVDGHAEIIPAARIKQATDSGINIARHPLP
ncbi:MAG: type II secretion system protein [Akkermansiaceae bacterium]